MSVTHKYQTTVFSEKGFIVCVCVWGCVCACVRASERSSYAYIAVYLHFKDIMNYNVALSNAVMNYSHHVQMPDVTHVVEALIGCHWFHLLHI